MVETSKDPKVVQATNQVVDKAADAIKVAARAENTTEPQDPPERKGKPKRYRSTAPAHVDGVYYKPGEPFVTNAPPAEDWSEISAKEMAADEASTNPIPDDANLEEAHIHALQAVAIIKHVPIAGIATNKDALITAIKAAYEPAL